MVYYPILNVWRKILMKLKRFGALALTLALTLSMTVVPARAVEFSGVTGEFWG